MKDLSRFGSYHTCSILIGEAVKTKVKLNERINYQLVSHHNAVKIIAGSYSLFSKQIHMDCWEFKMLLFRKKNKTKC